MNVRVDLREAIRDGIEVVFKAPCDYAEVTGLNVYYPLNGVVVSQTFAFADAHANDLADLDVLFAKDAVVMISTPHPISSKYSMTEITVLASFSESAYAP